MTMHNVSMLDIEKFRKVHALIAKGATAGERSAAKARAEAMAMKAGMTFAQAVSKLDGDAPAKSTNFFEGWDDWMEEREPGYKVRQAAEKAEKAKADAIRRKEVLAKYGSEKSLFARTEQERLLAVAVHDLAQWRDWIDDDGTVYTYADKIDGKSDFWKRADLSERVYSAIANAYPVPDALGGVMAEYLGWKALEGERDLFSGGEWNHHREVEARIAVLKDELDNRPTASWDDMDARMAWWDEWMTWGFMPNGDEERLRKERIAADLVFLRGCNSHAGVQVGQSETSASDEIRRMSRSNMEIRNAVLSMLDASPDLSDREISRRVGVSPQTVNNWRRRQQSSYRRKAA